MSLAQYFAMGGYAVFIWPCYALMIVLLVGVFVLASRRLATAARALEGNDPGADGRDEADPAS